MDTPGHQPSANFTEYLESLRLESWLYEYPAATASTYRSKEQKWRAFCKESAINSEELPTQEQVERFIVWLAHFAKKGGKPMAPTSIKQYGGRIAVTFDRSHSGQLNPFRSDRTSRFLTAVLRRMPKAKQRARPATFGEVAALVAAADHKLDPLYAAVLSFIAVLALWGCLRLCTIFGEAKGAMLPLEHGHLDLVRGSLFVTVCRDKTIRGPDDTHRIELKAVPLAPAICPVYRYIVLLEQFKRAGIQPTGSIASFGRNCVSSAALLAFFNKAVPSIAPTSECKGHFTKHSFRRGHVGEALAVGISLSDIMLFGNWRAAPSARNYTVGSVVSSSLASRAFRLPPSQ